MLFPRQSKFTFSVGPEIHCCMSMLCMLTCRSLNMKSNHVKIYFHCFIQCYYQQCKYFILFTSDDETVELRNSSKQTFLKVI